MSQDTKQHQTIDKGKTLSYIAGIPKRTKLIIVAAVALIFVISFPIICSIIGNRFGSTVGVAVGSFQAVTEDMPAAYVQGKEDGLSAVDTRVVVENKIREVGNLDVLAANAQITDMHQDGNKYAALYKLGADIIFSVDITKAKVLTDGSTMDILLPPPTGKINIDSTKTRLLEDWQRWWGNGQTPDGIDAFINSMKEIEKNASEKISEYTLLEDTARRSAKKQIERLAKMMMTDQNMNIVVHFDEKAGDIY